MELTNIMRFRNGITASALATLGIAASSIAFAQAPASPDTWRMPHERGFWGHAGASFGQSKLKDACISGFACDDKDQAFRLYAGGRFNNAVGLEVGLLNMGKFQRGGGETDGWGLDLALIAGIPIGANSAIFGKLGAIYGRTEVSGTATPAAGLQTGKERGFGARFGIGGQIGFTPRWAARVDWDRYRMPLPGRKEDLDTLMLGVQYTFR